MSVDVWVVLAGFVALWGFACISKWVAYDQ